MIKLSDGGGISTPQYSLVNQFDVDLSDFTESSSSTVCLYSVSYLHSISLRYTNCLHTILLHNATFQSYANIPTAFVLTVQLPEIRSASACELDITEQHIHLSTLQPVSYLLELDLPYPVDEDRGTARFDKTKRQLVSA